MDTKWKKMKKGISFLIFFAGTSLTLGSSVSLLQNMPGDFLRRPARVLQADYQLSGRFREYISGRLETFLAMATDSFGGSYYDYYDYYGDNLIESTTTGENTATVTQEPIPYEGMSEEELMEWQNWYYSYDNRPDRKDPLTDEERAQQCQKIAQQYHDSIKKDQNLLYSIAYDGKVLYSNSELLPTDGQLTAPEGYNFLLQYAEGKVRIFKDGKELDVYGDGYYRDSGSEWYVPGYRNFTVDEDQKKAVIYIAAVKEPVLYSESAYGRSSYRQMDNCLYWMQYNITARRSLLIQSLVCLTAGLVLLLAALLCRRSRREARADIARFTGKIWFEFKLLTGILVLYPTFLGAVMWLAQNYGYGDLLYLVEDTAYWAEAEEYGYSLSYAIPTLARSVCSLPAWIWLVVFWLLYFAANDLRHNKKVWAHGLIAKLYRSFTARDLDQPLPVKTAHRNAAAFVAAALFGVLMLAGGVIGFAWDGRNDGAVWGLGSLFFLILVGYLILQYRIGVKNMETARDIELLTDRIRNIRSGNYAENGGSSEENVREEGKSRLEEDSRLAGHDLEQTITELEDIRHGMANAVDEQMKSERMKVELIANVSHDIKTPLTSIISYVQFLKEEKELPEHVRDYVKILDEKSQRLKNMVQDVFAVSKAASGELPMHMEELDFGKLLRQTLADMEEQIADSKVTFRTEIPDAPVMIMADGQRMYRVFQNLFQNAVQYSLDGSRVFVTLQADGCMAVASVKNTSHQELEKDKDFTERFTRGDLSRTDGGSGLGLSIAQSFTEACGGSFSWETNADLFVVTVSFRITENTHTGGAENA